MKQRIGRKLLGVLLALAMVIGLVPGMGLTAYAAERTVTLQSGNTTPSPITGNTLADAMSNLIVGNMGGGLLVLMQLLQNL